MAKQVIKNTKPEPRANPCPFHNVEPVMDTINVQSGYRYAVRCLQCSNVMPVTMKVTIQEAIYEWNHKYDTAS